MAKKFSDAFPKGAKVEAFDWNGEDYSMQEGEIETHTCDMQAVTDGLIVRFDDGHRTEYGTEYLDTENPDNSYVQVKKQGK